MSNSAIRHTGLGEQDCQAISPYLRRPLRSLKEYLRDRKQRHNQPQETAADDAGSRFKEEEKDVGPATREGENDPD